jgi:hypothetical protein
MAAVTCSVKSEQRHTLSGPTIEVGSHILPIALRLAINNNAVVDS